MNRILATVFVVVSAIASSSAYSDGAIPHPKVCNKLNPNHGFDPESAAGKFHLKATRTASGIEVDIISDDKQFAFKGFVMRFSPRDAGKFVGGNTFQCDHPDDTVTHNQNNGKTSQKVSFVPNVGFETTPITFDATVVHSFTEIFGGLTTTV